MPHHIGLLQKIAAHDFDSHLQDAINVIIHRRRLLTGVSLPERGTDRVRVNDGVIEELASGVLLDGADEVGGLEIHGLAGLPHEIDEISLHCR